MADGRVVIDTELDSSGAEKDVSKLGNTLSKAGGTVAKGLGTALKGTAVAIGATATAITALGTKSIQLYSDYEQLAGGVDTLFKDSSKILKQYANNAYKDAGMSANQYMETVTGFSASLIKSLGGDTKKAAEYANQAVIDMSDNANKMGTSIESIQNAYQGFAKQNYTMLDNLKLGYGGTKEEMQRLLKDAEKLTGQKYDLSNFGDITQAIHAIQKEMGIAGATSDEAATTIQGSVGMMKSAWDNFLTGMSNPDSDFDALTKNLIDSVVIVGKNIVPKIESMLPQLVAGLTQLANSLIPMIPSIAQKLLPALLTGTISLLNSLMAMLPTLLPIISQMAIQLVMQLVTTILQMLPTILDLGLQLIIQLALGLAQQAPLLIDTIIDVCFKLIDSILSNLPLLIDAGLQLIIGLALGLVKAIPQIVKKIPEIIKNITQTLTKLLPLIIDAGIQLFVALIRELPTIINSISKAIPQIIDSVLSMLITLRPLIIKEGIRLFVALVKELPTIISTLAKGVVQIVSSLVTGLKNGGSKLAQAGLTLLKNIMSKLGEIKTFVTDKIKTIVTSMKTAITDKASEFKTIGKNLIEGLWKGIKGMKDSITKNVSNFFGGIVDSAKKKLGIHSPSKVFFEIGNYVVQGAVNGIQSLLRTAEKTAAELGNIIYTSANDELQKNTLDLKGSFFDMTQWNKQVKDISLNNASAMRNARLNTINSQNGTSNSTQIINIHQKISTPDELAREMRLAERYAV